VERDLIDRAKAAAERGDFAAAVGLLRPWADAGLPDAQFALALLALTECDLVTGREAFSLFQAAARQDHPAAMYYLATFPEFRNEPFQSPLSADEAWSWLIRAAELGYADAQYDAGAYLATGDWAGGNVIPQNLDESFAWYRIAAEAGHAEAQFNLATMLIEGEGCVQDLVSARVWLQRSLAGGCADAGELLSDLETFPTLHQS
jgi:TPR repeat protein